MKDRHLQLLTAFVDGELSQRERKVVLRLLHGSSEARTVLQQLQENAHALKQLPQQRLPEDFAAAVLNAMKPRTTAPPVEAAPALPARRSRLRLATALATAAAILLAASASWYYLLGRSEETSTGPIAPVAKAPNGLEPVASLSLRDLQEESQQRRLTQALQKEPAFHLDLHVPSSTHMVSKIKDVFKDKGIHVLVDPSAQVSLTKESKADYLVYLENIRPEEATALLSRLGMGEADILVVHSMNAVDRVLLAGFLETSHLQTTDKDGNLLLDTFIPKEKGKGKEQPPPQIGPRHPDRLALVLPLAAEGRFHDSAEIKSYLSRRQSAQPGTVQILLLVHQV